MSPIVLIILLVICVIIVFILSEQQTHNLPPILPNDEDTFMYEEEEEAEDDEDDEEEKNQEDEGISEPTDEGDRLAEIPLDLESEDEEIEEIGMFEDDLFESELEKIKVANEEESKSD